MAKKITMRAAREILACLFVRHLLQHKTSTLLGMDRTVIARTDHLVKEAGLKVRWFGCEYSSLPHLAVIREQLFGR